MASECHKAQNASSPPDEPTMPQSERDQLSTRHSIVFNTLVAFVVIIGFSLVSMLASLYLADALEGDAEAINQAGSLRMQAYRLAFTAEHGPQALLEERIDILERTLRSASLRSALHRHGDTPLPGLHGGVLQHWQERMRPLLDAQPPRLDDYRREAPEFVSELDVFVRTLQEASEGKLGVIRALQAGTLFIIVLIAFVLIYGLHNNLATPLRSLTKMARDIGKGDFSGRVEIPGDTELSLLARTLNQMSQELAGLYAEMEQKVDDKTAALTRSNATLQLLFNSARMLYSQPDDPSLMMGSLLTKVQEVLDTGPISLCLNRSAEAGSHTAMTSSDLQPPDYCKLPQCEVCPVNQSGRLPSGEELVTFELRSGQDDLGSLRVAHPAGEPLESWQTLLLTTLADLFAASLSLAQLGQKQARLALMEERAVIARELHDSLAQALSAQKLQLARLKRLMQKESGQAQLDDSVQQIDRGLNSAYRQLRELLTTFRIKVNEPGLKPALQATIKEFSANSGLLIEHDYQLDHCPLTPNEEVHCLQIIREALSNVVKHAEAEHCWLRLTQDDSGTIHVRIEDDGIGIEPEGQRAGHYGLIILQERASSLNGRISIDRRPGGGTLVHLAFPPVYRNIPVKQEPVTHERRNNHTNPAGGRPSHDASGPT
ncbi:type IV pili methyl-accepting chemotaxis transducer N-terminal domain-containing protein [Stutzerimonas stutzeri]|uniref:type IV pili methyl-accepting chemotaxis transducer N-terminal domain-containing protein n=1 Tax=Stutzerimonas stutzeri TaxID=316 RepID=UPI00244C5755|nr:type IV pili methyl-accepting chemotaxis transducer N-terminal domain-containing protein [Stutzerimonas stutzeri]MDH1672486.1 type IV pili methyl-accepting chemotaxis transducer N-terminal domain-containing protein [Stutzerimonas stutzeri]